MSGRRARRVARVVRGLPGYDSLVTRGLPRLRSQPLVVEVLTRLLGDHGRIGRTLLPLRSTPLPQEVRAASPAGPVDLWPVLVLDAVDVPGAALDEVLDSVLTLQREQPVFRPVLLLAGADLGPARRRNLPVEILPPGSDEESRLVRTVSMGDHYRAWTILRLAPDGLTEEHRRLVAALTTHLERQARIRDAAADARGPATA